MNEYTTTLKVLETFQHIRRYVLDICIYSKKHSKFIHSKKLKVFHIISENLSSAPDSTLYWWGLHGTIKKTFPISVCFRKSFCVKEWRSVFRILLGNSRNFFLRVHASTSSTGSNLICGIYHICGAFPIRFIIVTLRTHYIRKFHTFQK